MCLSVIMSIHDLSASSVLLSLKALSLVHVALWLWVRFGESDLREGRSFKTPLCKSPTGTSVFVAWAEWAMWPEHSSVIWSGRHYAVQSEVVSWRGEENTFFFFMWFVRCCSVMTMRSYSCVLPPAGCSEESLKVFKTGLFSSREQKGSVSHRNVGSLQAMFSLNWGFH